VKVSNDKEEGTSDGWYGGQASTLGCLKIVKVFIKIGN
jgi:hypothetical protein